MKIRESKLRQIIKEEVMLEFTSSRAMRKELAQQEKEESGKRGNPEIKTVGDLKKLIAKATNKKKDSIRGAGVADAATGMLADLIPGAGTIKDLGTAAVKAYRLPDKAKSQTGLDHLNVDDGLSKIVNDEIENAFLKSFAQKFAGMPDETPLERVQINTMLAQFIASKFNNRTLTGFEKGT